MSNQQQRQLATAISIATEAHAGQFDKGGKPYILHPLHLMSKLMFDPQLAAIAVLHDVIEDSSMTIKGLMAENLSLRIVQAVDILTKKEGIRYHDYIENICTNYDAIRVKRKDLEHNSDITRLKGVGEKDIARIEKYHKAFVRLTEAKRNFRGGEL